MSAVQWTELTSGDQVRLSAGGPDRTDFTYTVLVVVGGADPSILLRAYNGAGAVDLTLTPDMLTSAEVTASEPWEALAEHLPEWVRIRAPGQPIVFGQPPLALPRRLAVFTSLRRVSTPHSRRWRLSDRFFSRVADLNPDDLSREGAFLPHGAALTHAALRSAAHAQGWRLTVEDTGTWTRVTLLVHVSGRVIPVQSHGLFVGDGMESGALVLARALRLAAELRAQHSVSR